MQLEQLTIGLKSPYSKPSETNIYEAKLQVSFNDNRMTVVMSKEVCAKILELAGEEIAAAAQVQISTFVRQALSVSKTPMIEGSAL